MRDSAACHPVVLLRIVFILAALYFNAGIKAQPFNGSLGDPVLNITFGSGDNNSIDYTPTNAYNYTSSACPGDGYYTITKTTSGCFGDAWHTVTSDHTGNGAFMLINASSEPGDFFVDTVTDLCPNTVYQFSAWLMNVLKEHYGSKPDITFSIEAADNSLLAQYSTGDIPETVQPVWNQYGFYFTTPADNVAVILRITNNAPGGLGNDLALDDISLRPCGPKITATIQNNPDTLDICEDNTNTYTLSGDVSAGFDMPVYQWQMSTDKGTSWQDISGANILSLSIKPATTGFYWYRLTVAEQVSAAFHSCRVASNTIAIHVHTKPEVSAGTDKISFSGKPVTLEGAVKGELPEYFWSPPSYLDNDRMLTPKASPPSDFNYTLYAISKYGCKNSDVVQVKAVPGILVPNAFTPNNDGKNDRWHIIFSDPSLDAVVSVYNRFGQVVFHTEGKTVSWDGTYNGFAQPQGAYVYTIRLKSEHTDIKGVVILIR